MKNMSKVFNKIKYLFIISFCLLILFASIDFIVIGILNIKSDIIIFIGWLLLTVSVFIYLITLIIYILLINVFIRLD